MFSGNHHGRAPLSKLVVPTLLLLLCALHAQAQTDFLTFTGVWTTVPVTGLSSPRGIAGDTAGNLYISDFSQFSIVKIAPDGTQSAVGTVNGPAGIAIDSAQDLIVASNGDNKVYRITSIGGVQTQIGSGWSSPLSVAVDSNGNVFVVDGSGLSKVTPGGTQSLVVSAANLQGLAVDQSGNVYYGDNNNSSVYEVLAGTSTVVPHNPSNSVRNLYIDAQGALYMAQTHPGAQRSDDANTDYTTFGDTGITEGVWGTGQTLYLVDASGVVEKIALGAVDFGSFNVCINTNVAPPCTSTQILHFALDSNVIGDASSRVATQGLPGPDFTLGADTCTTVFASGGACTMTVVFAPNGVGLRTGAAQSIGETIVNTIAHPVGPQPQARPAAETPRPLDRPLDQPPGTLLTSVLLHGIGIGPIGVFNTAPIETYNFGALTNPYPQGVILTVDGSLYVVDYNNCVVQQRRGNNTTIVAGTVCGASAGDGGLATAATLNAPSRIVIDGAGNMYISEYSGHIVRRVDGLTGLISTIAGNGTPTFAGDGGLATNASLNRPGGLALDTSGNLFIADQNNNAVRRVDALTGTISTFAGIGMIGPGGYTGDGGPATSATLRGPNALAFDDAGNLYIADDQNNVIRKVTAGTITTLAGTGTFGYSGDGGPATSAQLADPEGISVDPAGNVYIADSSNYLVRKVEVSTGTITTVAGTFNGTLQSDEQYTGDGGPAIHAGLSYVQDVFVDQYDEIWIADAVNGVVRVVTEPYGLADFGTVSLGAVSAAQTVRMSNVGNSPLALSALQIPAQYSLAGGATCTTPLTLTVGEACNFSIQMAPTTDGSQNAALSITDSFYNDPAYGQFIVLSGTGTGSAPAQLAFAAAIPAIGTGGNPGVIVVNIEAGDSSIVTGATNSVTLTITGPGGFSHVVTVSAVNGMATFDLTSLPLTTPGAYTFTATSTSLTQVLANVSVIANTPGPAQLAIPSSVTAAIPVGGNPGIVPVSIENSSAALVNGATNPVTLTITGPGGYSHTVTAAAVNGIASFDLTSLSLTTPGVYSLTATSDGLASAFATVTVISGGSAPAQLAISGSLPAIVPTGASLGVVPVDIDTVFGAIASGASNVVTLTITGPGGFARTVTVNAVNGIASFDLSGLALNTTGVYTLIATSSGLTQAAASVTVTAGSVTTTPVQLTIPPSVPAMVASGGDLGIVPVDIDNSSGLIIPGASNTVTLTITGPGGFTYTATVSAVHGVANFDLSSVPLTVPGTYTLTATSGRLTQALASVTVSTDFTIAVTASTQASIGPIAPGTAATFSFTLAPASGTFPASIALSAKGLPPGSTFSFAPTAVTPGSNAVGTALAIQTSRTASAALAPFSRGWLGFGSVSLGLLLLPLSGSRRMRTAFRRTPMMAVVLLLLALGSAAGLAGCGAGGLFGHPQQSYTITVTGTSGSVSHSATVTLSVE